MKGKILIAYYSHSGNTAEVARLIEEKTGGTAVEIAPVTAYPADYSGVLKQAREEIKKGYMPPIKPIDIGAYDTIIAGTPNWCGTLAPPVASFLTAEDFSGKRVALFVTHGGGGPGNTFKDAAKLCPQAELLGGLDIYASGGADGPAKLDSWLKKIGLI